MTVPVGFTPISVDDYVVLHVRRNPGTDPSELRAQIGYAVQAHLRDERCACGARIWILGSSQVGPSCFTCITGEAAPDDDYEIDVRQ